MHRPNRLGFGREYADHLSDVFSLPSDIGVISGLPNAKADNLLFYQLVGGLITLF